MKKNPHYLYLSLIPPHAAIRFNLITLTLINAAYEYEVEKPYRMSAEC